MFSKAAKEKRRTKLCIKIMALDDLAVSSSLAKLWVVRSNPARVKGVV
jgi:hypothetical protein